MTRLARQIGFVLLFSSPALAAITGTVINRGTGLPQPGATVVLNRLGQGGIEMIDQAKSDAQGHFTINQELQGPSLIRTAFDGVTYNHMLPPGSPTSGITVDVYNSSKQPGAAKVTKHMLLFQPSGSQVVINESFIFANDGKTAWNDPDDGTLHFYAPKVDGKIEVSATAPGGMAIPAPVNKTSKPDIYAVDFAIKPGETRIDLSYAVAYIAGAPYEGKIATKDDNTYLIVPNGMTLQGDNLSDLGNEPRTQAHIYGLTASTYKVQFSGTAAEPPPSATADSADQADSGAPQIEQIMPRVFGQAKLILALALGILALGFVLLYRMPVQTPKEPNERGRR